MGKKGWLTAVKRAFRSPSKESEKKASRRKEEPPEVDEDTKKNENKRWIFRKSFAHESSVASSAAVAGKPGENPVPAVTEHRRAMAVAIATATAAEAAAASAKAAAEVVRLAGHRPPSFSGELHFAAIVIQTAFRGYLARRTLKALRGLVKLQALVRGQNVRRQASTTLRCMEALVRVQSRVRDQRLRLSQEPDGLDAGAGAAVSSTMSSSSCDASFWGSRFSHENRKSTAIRATSRIPSPASSLREMVAGEEAKHAMWLEQWMASREPWDYEGRDPAAAAAAMIKTLEVDIERPYSSSGPAAGRRPSSPAPSIRCSLSTPSAAPSSKPLQVARSASPRCGAAARSSSPGYMAATESTRARERSQSAPRHRAGNPPEKDRSAAKKRLWYPGSAAMAAADGNYQEYGMRIPSFKSTAGSIVSSSSCAESFAAAGRSRRPLPPIFAGGPGVGERARGRASRFARSAPTDPSRSI